MGTCISKMLMSREKRRTYQRRLDKQLEKYQSTVTALNMSTADAKLLYMFFVDVDEDGSGEVSVEEFFKYLDLKMSVFSKRVFTMFDADGSGEIDFREFIVSLVSYCTADKAGLIAFAFRLYDTDSSGLLDIGEIQQLVREVYGDDFKNSKRAHAIMGKIEYFAKNDRRFANPDGEVSEEVFTKFAVSNPALLFPAFQLQMELQERIMGTKYWRRQTKKQLTAGAFKGSLEEFQKFMQDVHEDSFRELVANGRAAELELSDDEDGAGLALGVGSNKYSRGGRGRGRARGGGGRRGGPAGRKRGAYGTKHAVGGGRPSNKKLRLLRKADIERMEAEQAAEEEARRRGRRYQKGAKAFGDAAIQLQDVSEGDLDSESGSVGRVSRFGRDKRPHQAGHRAQAKAPLKPALKTSGGKAGWLAKLTGFGKKRRSKVGTTVVVVSPTGGTGGSRVSGAMPEDGGTGGSGADDRRSSQDSGATKSVRFAPQAIEQGISKEDEDYSKPRRKWNATLPGRTTHVGRTSGGASSNAELFKQRPKLGGRFVSDNDVDADDGAGDGGFGARHARNANKFVNNHRSRIQQRVVKRRAPRTSNEFNRLTRGLHGQDRF